MKQGIKKVFLLLSIFIFVLIIASCSSASKEYSPNISEYVHLYNQTSKEYDGLKMALNVTNTQTDDHILTLKYEISFEKTNKDYPKISLTNTEALGNDLPLVEEVLSNYDSADKTKNTKFGVFDEVVKEEKTTLDFYVVIRDGNPLCKYQITLDFNETSMNLYSYSEGYELDNFLYVHNPEFYSNATIDATYDSSCIYGYKPNETGSLKGYAKYDWTNKEAVEGYKENRIKYVDENDKSIKALENSLKEEGKSIEEIARACSSLRNQIRLNRYKDDPEGLATLKQRNLEKYGHEEGPLPDELYQKYGSWETVLEKCYSTNPGMDACCGVYDKYYNMYTTLAY